MEPGSLWLLTLKHVGLHGPLLQKYQQFIYNCVRISRNVIQDGFLITQSLCIISSWFYKELKMKHLHQSLKEGAWWATVHGIQRVRQDWATNAFIFWKKNGLQALCPLCFLGLWALRGGTPSTGIRHNVVNSPQCQHWGFYWLAVLGPSHISVEQRQNPRRNLWSEVCRKLLVYSYTGIQSSRPEIKL